MTDTVSLYLRGMQLLSETDVSLYVIAKDENCEIIFRHKPICVIQNVLKTTDKRPMGHWVAMYYSPVRCSEEFECEAFDSYGESLEYYQLKPCVPVTKENRTEYQASDSTVCGIYSLMYLLYKCRGKSLKQFQELFSDTDFEKNDNLIVRQFKVETTRLGANRRKCVTGGQHCHPKTV